MGGRGTRDLVPAGSVFAFLADHRRELFPDEIAELFPSNGRRGLPADLVASTIVLRALHGLSDAEAVAALRFDLRWKVAYGLPVGHREFHPTSLTYWRGRLAASQRPERIFDAVRDVVTATGLLAGKTRRVLDSTVLADAVSTQDRVTQLIAAICWIGRVVAGAQEVIAAHCRGHDYTRPRKPSIAWKDTDARDGRQRGLVTDALALLDAVDEPPPAPRPPRRSHCWRWSPARTSNPPTVRTARTGSGGSPARCPRAGDLHGGPGPGTSTSPANQRSTATRRT